MKKKSLMFQFINRTWNPVTGCRHNCSYCWARKLAETKLKHLQRYQAGFTPLIHPYELLKKFKPGEFVFVCDMGDLFGWWVPRKWIEAVLEVIGKNPDTKFLLLTKNPKRIFNYWIPTNCIVGATIETNRPIPPEISKARPPSERFKGLAKIQFPDTIRYIHKIIDLFRVRKKFVVLKPEMSFFQRLEHFHFWPAITKLWCNQYLKRRPIRRFYKTLNPDEIDDYVGISVHDSPARAARYTEGKYDYRMWSLDRKKKISVVYRYPLLHWTDSRKAAYMNDHDIPKNPLYKTVGSSGCYFCPFFHKPNYLKLKCYYPELFNKLCMFERKLGKRASPDFWLRSLASQQHLTEWLPAEVSA